MLSDTYDRFWAGRWSVNRKKPVLGRKSSVDLLHILEVHSMAVMLRCSCGRQLFAVQFAFVIPQLHPLSFL